MPHADPEQRRAYAAAYRAKSREKARLRSAQWREDNPDRVVAARQTFDAEYHRKWRATNPESSRAASAKWAASHGLERDIYHTLRSLRVSDVRNAQQWAELWSA